MFQRTKKERDAMSLFELARHYDRCLAVAARIEADNGMVSPDEEAYLREVFAEILNRPDKEGGKQ